MSETWERGSARRWMEGVRAEVRMVRRERGILEARTAQAYSIGSLAPSTGGSSGHGPRNAIEENAVACEDARQRYEEATKQAACDICAARDYLADMRCAGEMMALCSQAIELRYVDDMTDAMASRALGIGHGRYNEVIDAGLDWMDNRGPFVGRLSSGTAEA